jgi:hypothetical protein
LGGPERTRALSCLKFAVASILDTIGTD